MATAAVERALVLWDGTATLLAEIKAQPGRLSALSPAQAVQLVAARAECVALQTEALSGPTLAALGRLDARLAALGVDAAAVLSSAGGFLRARVFGTGTIGPVEGEGDPNLHLDFQDPDQAVGVPLMF